MRQLCIYLITLIFVLNVGCSTDDELHQANERLDTLTKQTQTLTEETKKISAEAAASRAALQALALQAQYVALAMRTLAGLGTSVFDRFFRPLNEADPSKKLSDEELLKQYEIDPENPSLQEMESPPK